MKAYRAEERAYLEEVSTARTRQFNLFSQRIAARLKLDVAEELVHDTFYYPHNIDFRGRVYSISPHLQHLGDDLARGLLLLAEPKPLGARGLYWLKVQLANLYGQDKLSLDGRVAWTDSVIAQGTLARVNASPLEPEVQAWWMAADDPLQVHMRASNPQHRPPPSFSLTPVARYIPRIGRGWPKHQGPS